MLSWSVTSRLLHLFYRGAFVHCDLSTVTCPLWRPRKKLSFFCIFQFHDFHWRRTSLDDMKYSIFSLTFDVWRYGWQCFCGQDVKIWVAVSVLFFVNLWFFSLHNYFITYDFFHFYNWHNYFKHWQNFSLLHSEGLF